MIRTLLVCLVAISLPITEKAIAQRSKIVPPEVALPIRSDDLEYSKDVIIANDGNVPKLVLNGPVVIGQVGYVYYRSGSYRAANPARFEVFQVINETEAILSLNNQHYWVSKINASRIADGDGLQLSFPVKLIGTKSYTTAFGSQKTIDHLVGVELQAELLEFMEEVKTQKLDDRYFKIRAWEIEKDKFTVARFHSYDRKELKLELPNGEIISYEYGDIPSKTRKLADSIHRFIERQQEKK